jgi:hypothetical protein
LTRAPSHDIDQALSTVISRALEAARAKLMAEMARCGLAPSAGWRIKEDLRHTTEGTEWIFSPIHLREPSPGLEVRVCIDGEGRLLDPCP